MRAALRDLLTKKRTRLGRPLFESLMKPPLRLAPLLLPALLDHALALRSDYLRGEAGALLAAALKVGSPAPQPRQASRLTRHSGTVTYNSACCFSATGCHPQR